MRATFHCSGLTMTRLWHCFGNYTHRADLGTIRRLLDASGANVIPINTHRLDPGHGRERLEIGFAGVTYDELRATRGLEGTVVMLNINHQQSAKQAVERTRRAHALSGIRAVKLEVLNADLRTSNDAELVEAVKLLNAWNPDLILMPLLSNCLDTARDLVDLGVPLLRVMGGAIGSCAGIQDRATFVRICGLGVPVILDGGIGSAKHYHEARELGATGGLVNSMLFESSAPPESVMASFVAECARLAAASGLLH